MDNFTVDLSNKFDPRINKTLKRDNKGCGQYNGSVSPGAKVELQCKDKEAYSRYVIIQQDVGKQYLTIPELEVMGECELTSDYILYLSHIYVQAFIVCYFNIVMFVSK